jgi:hypothetical protein
MSQSVGGNSNPRIGKPAEVHTTPAEDFAALEDLPTRIREAVFSLNVAISAERVLEAWGHVQRVGIEGGWPLETQIEAMILWCREFEQRDLRTAAAQHRARYGYQMPHVAAGIAVLRSVGPPRSRRRRQRFIPGYTPHTQGDHRDAREEPTSEVAAATG